MTRDQILELINAVNAKQDSSTTHWAYSDDLINNPSFIGKAIALDKELIKPLLAASSINTLDLLKETPRDLHQTIVLNSGNMRIDARLIVSAVLINPLLTPMLYGQLEACRLTLNKYIEKVKKRRNGASGASHNFFRCMQSDEKQRIKLEAAEKLFALLIENKTETKFRSNELAVLSRGKLGKIVRRCFGTLELPKVLKHNLVEEEPTAALIAHSI